MTSAMTRRLYVTSWLMLGAIAIGYFFTLYQAYRNPQTAQMTPSQQAQWAKPNDPSNSTDPSLSRALIRMRAEIDLLKVSLESANKENTALKAHIKTLESAFGPSTSALPPEPKKPDPNPLKEDASSRPESTPKVEISVLEMPSDGFSDYFPEAPLPIAGQDTPKRTLFAVEVARGVKKDSLEERWRELKKRHPKLLGKLQPRSVTSGPTLERGNKGHKLIAGPFENAAAAARLCARLNAAGSNCEGTVFSGAPLGNIATR